jgi:hypothetical protein
VAEKRLHPATAGKLLPAIEADLKTLATDVSFTPRNVEERKKANELAARVTTSLEKLRKLLGE